MTDNVAVLEGYTRELMAYSSAGDLFILVKPGADLDDTFKAWDSDNQEFVRISGWLWTFEELGRGK